MTRGCSGGHVVRLYAAVPAISIGESLEPIGEARSTGRRGVRSTSAVDLPQPLPHGMEPTTTWSPKLNRTGS